MKAASRFCFRFARAALAGTGGLALLFAAVQFSPLPWRIYKSLSEIPAPDRGPPTDVLVLGGSGIPGESGLMRTFYAAQAAAQYPRADVLVAMPLGAAQSDASRAYLAELRLRGVAGQRLRILDGGRNTREQALRLAEHLAGKSPRPHVLVVSSPEHVRRTAACIRKAFAEQNIEIHLSALPAFPLSIEDSVPARPGDSADAGSAPAARAADPDPGVSWRLRYSLWTNFRYTADSLREGAALLYYRLRGWV